MPMQDSGKTSETVVSCLRMVFSKGYYDNLQLLLVLHEMQYTAEYRVQDWFI